MKKYKLIILMFFTSMNFFVFSETIKDNLEIKVEIPSYFSMSIETYLIPFHSFSANNLLQPSQNTIIPEKNLNGMIDMGHLIAQKKEQTIYPLISEYKVLMQVKCETNRNQSYTLSQTLNAPLRGISSGVFFPEKAFVFIAGIDNMKGLNHGQIMTPWEMPIIPHDTQIIYKSGETGSDYLGNLINICYWISDQQEDKVYVDQRTDTYESTITISMVEL